MKTRLLSLVCFFCSIMAASAFGMQEKSAERSSHIIVYAYDSFTAEWGAGPVLSKMFEEKTGITCTLVSAGDAAQVLSRAVLEKKKPAADVLLGIDNNLAAAAVKHNVLLPYKPAGADEIINKKYLLDKEYALTPYDWSYFAIIYDTQSSVPCPSSLESLTDSVYRKKLILMDPRTSTPGLGFAAWTEAVYGAGVEEYWKKLQPNILSMAPGWDTGYGLFTSGEAPLVISYTTSPAYHVEYDKTDRYKAAFFSEGHPVQIEGAGVVRGAPNEKGAKLFIDFLISLDAQKELPLTQWMYPVHPGVKLPESYAKTAAEYKMIETDPLKTDSAVKKIMTVLSK